MFCERGAVIDTDSACLNCLFSSLKTEMLDESHKRKFERMRRENPTIAENEEVEVDLKMINLKYTLRQIRRAIFGPDEKSWPKGVQAARDKDVTANGGQGNQEGEDVPTVDDVLLWVGLNFIESCVTKKVFSAQLKQGAGFWDWVTVSDVAFVFMVLDMHYEGQKRLWVKGRSDDSVETASAVLNTEMRVRYADYQQWLKMRITEKGGKDWQHKFNDDFEVEEAGTQRNAPKKGKVGGGEVRELTGQERIENNLLAEWLGIEEV